MNCVMLMCASQAVQPTKKTSDMLRAIREASQAMHQQSAGVGALPPGEIELRRWAALQNYLVRAC